MWKRKAKKAAGKGSTLIQTGKAAALAAKQQAQVQPVPIRHGGHNPNAQKASAAVTAAMLAKAAKQAAEDAPIKVILSKMKKMCLVISVHRFNAKSTKSRH